MMRLSHVSLSFREKGADRDPILRDVSLSLPANRRLGILGEDPKALTEILLMLAGTRKPDQGRIDCDGMRRSPVVNAGSVPGRTLVAQLTAIENIRLAATMHGLDETELIARVESGCQIGKMLSVRVNNFDRPMRRKFESTLIAAIPFDCYYIDKLHEFAPPIIWRFVHVAVQRGAGILFTSRLPNQIQNFSQLRATVRDGSLELWDKEPKAIAGEVE